MNPNRRSTRPIALITVALATTLALAGCAGSPAPRSAAPVAVADVPDLEARALLLLLAERRLYEPYTVEKALDGGRDLQRQLALTLGRVGDPAGRPVLEAMLLEDDPGLRRTAAFALGQLGDPEALSHLWAVVSGEDRAAAVLAVEAAARLGAGLTEVLAPLLEVPDEERLPRILPHLFRFDDDFKITLAQQALERDLPSPELRRRAAYALTRRPREEALPTLRRLVADEDVWIRAQAAAALGRVGEAEDLGRLRPLLDARDPSSVIQAWKAAHRIVGRGVAAAPAEWLSELLNALEDRRTGVRLTALEVAGAWLLDEALGGALVKRASPAWTEDGGTPRERELALAALAEGRHPRALDLLVTAAGDGEVSIRRQAARVAGRIDGESLLVRLSADPELGVRSAAWEERLRQAEGAALVGLTVELLTDEDPGLRGAALQRLVSEPVLPFEALNAAFEEAARDRIVTARLNAVAALGARAQAERLERGGILLRLEELAGHADPLVRARAAAALVDLEQPRPAPGPPSPGRGIGVYRQIVQQTAADRDVEIRTRHGAVRIRLTCAEAPLTCLSFLQLIRQGFYEGLEFHRVVPDFVVQGGDPRGDGRGGPGYTVPNEAHLLRFRRGVLGMARSFPDTNGSQFFLTLSPQPHLDGDYTAFGHVVDGLEVLDSIEQGEPIESIIQVR